MAPSAAENLARHLVIFIGQANALDVSQGIGVPMRLAAIAALETAGPVALGSIIAASAAVLLQTGMLLDTSALTPKFSRVNPKAGLKRLFGSDGESRR